MKRINNEALIGTCQLPQRLCQILAHRGYRRLPETLYDQAGRYDGGTFTAVIYNDGEIWIIGDRADASAALRGLYQSSEQSND